MILLLKIDTIMDISYLTTFKSTLYVKLYQVLMQFKILAYQKLHEDMY